MLSALFTEISGNFATLWSASNPGAVPAVTSFCGSEFLEGQDAGNRVVWVPGRDRWAGPEKQTAAQPNPVVPAGGIPRSLRTRWMGLELHLWGQPPAVADPVGSHYFDSIDDMLRWLIVAIHEATYGCYRIVDGGFVRSQQGGAFTTYGREYVLVVEMSTPIEDQNVTTVTLESLPVTDQLSPFLPGHS